jgi:endonuclease-3
MPATPRTKPRATQRARATRILDALEEAYPEATCALAHRDAFQLMVATILSAQCTDKRVNLVTPALFRRFPTAGALAKADTPELEELIRATGFFRSKARNLKACAAALVEHHGGVVPRSLAELVKLPGIGRKTASVVLGHAYGIAEGIAVDTHVLRLSRRLGLADGSDATAVERQLLALIPERRWIATTDLLIAHGRSVCDARRPTCGECILFPLCRFEGRQAHATGTRSHARHR